MRIVVRIAMLASLAALLASCGGTGNGNSVATSQRAGTDPAAASSGRGLLLPRDQRLLLRDMADGKETVLKRSGADTFFTYPRWSPDGKRIAYALDVPFLGQPNQQWGSDIIVAASDGSAEQIVLKRPAAGLKVEGLEWAADGASLFAGILDTNIKDGRLISQTLRLERVEIATGQRQTVVEDATYPAASRDGTRLAFVTYGDTGKEGGLWVANTDGSNRKLIVPSTGRFVAVAYPRFSPDGKSIAFSAVTLAAGGSQNETKPAAWRWPWQPRVASAHGLPQDVWTVPVDGGEPRRVTSFLEDEPYPTWSPDGSQLAIVATGGLYTVVVAGGEPKKLGLGGTQVQIDWR